VCEDRESTFGDRETQAVEIVGREDPFRSRGRTAAIEQACLDASRAQAEFALMSIRIARSATAILTLLAPFLAPACGGSGGSSDPRCAALCTITQPDTPNVGDVCSQASADACRSQCEAHVADTTAPCGDCLLEDAEFGNVTEGGGGYCESTAACPDGECTESGPGGDCTYCTGDMAAEEQCYAKAHPRREVECKTEFRDPAKCSALCAAK
jgi:hypothetical protein